MPFATPNPRARAIVAINVAALIFGSAALFGKLNVSPAWIVAVRAFFAALSLGPWVIGGKGLVPVPRDIRLALAASGVLLAVHWLLFYATVQIGSVAMATLTFASFPLFTLLIESQRHRRVPDAVELGAVSAILIAVLLLVVPGSRLGTPVALLAGLASAFAYALYWRCGGRLGVALSPTAVSFFQSAVIVIGLLPALPFAGPHPASIAAWLWLLWFGIVNTALALQLYLFALKHLKATTCSGFVAMEPVYAIGLAALLFGDPIPPRVILSGALIISACLVLLRRGVALAGRMPAFD